MTPARLRGGRLALGGGVAACAGAALLLLAGGEEARLDFLAAFATGASIASGGLVLLLIAHATGAEWMAAVRRPIEAVAASAPAYLLLFVAVALEAPRLYAWASPGADLPGRTLETIAATRIYLSVPSFVARGAVAIALWSALALLLLRWSFASDADDPAPSTVTRPRALSSAALPLVALTIHLAARDWIATLAPGWRSSIIGIYWFAGGFTAAVAAATLAVLAAARAGALPPEIGPSHRHALGKLLLVGVCLWAYAAFFQGFLIWIANEPEEASWLALRTSGRWLPVFWTVVAAKFALPFAALLSRELKRRAPPLAAVCAWLLAAHWLDVRWLVVPEGGAASTWPGLAAAGAVAAVGGLALLSGALAVRGAAAFPRNDPRALAGLEYEGR